MVTLLPLTSLLSLRDLHMKAKKLVATGRQNTTNGRAKRSLWDIQNVIKDREVDIRLNVRPTIKRYRETRPQNI